MTVEIGASPDPPTNSPDDNGTQLAFSTRTHVHHNPAPLPFALHLHTLPAAETLRPRLIRGVDIDVILIRSARQRLEQRASLAGGYFPVSLPLAHGPIAAAPKSAERAFPDFSETQRQVIQDAKQENAKLSKFFAGE